jgi:hypothetical protein
MAKKTAQSEPRPVLHDCMSSAASAATREELDLAIDSIASAIRVAWYELRTEDDVIRVARGLAGDARGMCMMTIFKDVRSGRDPFRNSFSAK